MAAELIAELQSAREHLRRVADDLGGSRELGPKLAIVNPPRWEIGHVGWFQEWWCLRDASEERASILPNADGLYNSATVAHATRWNLPLPSFADTLAYRDEVTERVVGRLRRGDADPYFVRLAVRHEDMHAEAFHYTRQTLRGRDVQARLTARRRVRLRQRKVEPPGRAPALPHVARLRHQCRVSALRASRRREAPLLA
jgi:iron(II)-dependent oxidoreductase